MRLRNQILAILCVLAFIGLGVLYFKSWVVQKPFGIILFVGDGLTSSNLTVARIYKSGASHRLALEKMPHMALLTNYANDFAVPDAAAAVSAIATGVKCNNHALAVSPQGKSLTTILDLARKSGRSVGIVTNGNLTDPGVAVFYAHTPNDNNPETIARQLVNAPKIDVLLGGGAQFFLPEGRGGKRKDGHDLIAALQKKGRHIIRNKTELENEPIFGASGLIGIFSQKRLAYSDQAVEKNQSNATNQQPSFPEMVRRAIQFLQMNPRGYFLVVDNELGTKAALQNDEEHTITELLDFDRAISTAKEYAGSKSLIIATGKTAIGGMTLNGYPLRQDHGVALLGTNPFGYPSISWASGPNGAQPDSATATAGSPLAKSATPPNSATTAKPPEKNSPSAKSPAAFYSSAAINNADDILAVGSGPGSEKLHGFQDNTLIFKIINTEF